MEEKALVTVIVPIYQVAEYLPDCIESIRRQTYRRLQILLIDDGSPDDCGQICDHYAHIDSRIQTIHRPNGGVGAARNTGLDAANGDYICFVDGDDQIAQDMVQCALTELEKEVCGLCTWGFQLWKNGKTIYSGRRRKKVFRFDTEGEKARFLCRWFFTARTGWEVCRGIFQKALIDRFQLRFGDASLGEDMDFTFRYLLHCQGFCSIPKPLYVYRIHSSSAMRSLTQMKRAEQLLYILQRQKADLSELVPLQDFFIYEAVAVAFYIGKPKGDETLLGQAKELLELLQKCRGWEELKADACLAVQSKGKVRKYCGPPYSELVLAFCQFLLDGDEGNFLRNVWLYQCFLNIRTVKDRLLHLKKARPLADMKGEKTG